MNAVAASALATGALALGCGLAVAAPSDDQLAGTGTIAGYGTPTLHLNAVDTSMQGWKGSFTIDYPTGTHVEGKVTDGQVDSNKVGYAWGQVTESNDGRWVVGEYVVMGVLDEGQPGVQPPKDALNFSVSSASPPGTGQAIPSGDPNLTLIEGNLRVSDSDSD
jgi:hypothetical protein